MIKPLIELWEKNSDKLRQYFKDNVMSTYGSYEAIFNAINEKVFECKFHNVRVLDFGDYQGTQIFVFTDQSYQPSTWNTYWTAAEYGSCECCDQLLGIMDYEEGKPTEKQVNQFMSLALHMVQKIHCFDPNTGDNQYE